MRHDKLQQLSKSDAIELATRMRNKARNVKLSAAETSKKLVRTSLGAGAAFATGYWMGGLRHEKSGMTDAQIESEGDPTKWAGVDKDLAVGIVVTGLGVMNVGGKKVAPALEWLGGGVLAGWAYSRGDQSGYEAAKET